MADSRLNVTVNPAGAISGAQKAAKALKSLGLAAERTEASLRKLESRSVRIKVDGRALANLKRTATSVQTSLQAISKVTIKPKVDARALTNLRKTANSVTSALKQINNASVKPKTNLRPVTDLTKAARTAKTSLKDINKIKVAPSVNPAGVVALEATMGTLIKAVGVLTTAITALNTNLARSGVVGTAAMGKIAVGANVATAAVGRLATASAVAGTTAGLSSAKLGAGTAVAAGGFGVFIGQAGKAGVAANLLKTSFRGLGLAAGALAGAVGLAGGTLLATTIKFSDAAIMVRNRIRLVTETTEELNQVNNELFRQSRDARVPLTAQAELYQRIGLSMEQLGASTNDVLSATEATAKAITLSAVTFQAANATIIQFGQALAFGKLRGDELRSVLEQSPRLAQALADGLGIARGELIKFGFAGKLASDRVFKALISQLPILREEFKLIQPRISEAGNAFQNSLIKLSSAVNDVTGISSGIAQGILDVADAISDKTPAIINALLDIKLEWIKLRNLISLPFRVAGSTFDKLRDTLQGVLPTDQQITRGPFEAIADGIDWFNKATNANFKELRLAGEQFRKFGEDIELGVTTAGAALDPTNLPSNIGGLFGIGGTDYEAVYNQGVTALEELNALTLERKELQIDVNARDAAREVQDAADGLKSMVDGYELTQNINLEVNGAKAEIALPQLQKDIDALRQERIRIGIQIDMPGAEKELQALNKQVALFKDRDSVIYQNLLKKKEAYAAILESVKEGNYLGKNEADLSKNQLEQVEAIRKAWRALEKVLPEIPEEGETGTPSTRRDLINERDPTNDVRAVNAYLDKQKQLIVELTTIEGIERDLAQLRLKAGDLQVSRAEDQIRANQALIESQEKYTEIEEGSQKVLEQLQKRIDKTDELTAAQQLQKDIDTFRVRTSDEEEQFRELKAKLLSISQLDEAQKQLIDTSELLEIALRLEGTISAEERLRLDLRKEEIKLAEEQLAAELLLAKVRKQTLSDNEKRVEEGVNTPAGQRARELEDLKSKLAAAQALVDGLLSKSEKLDKQQLENLEKAQKAVELFQQDIIEANQLFQDFTIDAVEAVREAAEQMNAAMSDFFFDAMQGNFDNLLQNLVNSFKAAIDRMVADALAAALMEKLVGNGGFIGDFLSVLMGVGGAVVSGGGVGGSGGGGGGGGGTRLGGAAKGGFQAPGKFMEVNELGQEALILGAKNFLIPTGDQVSRITPPALMGQVRGLESGGFARPSEMIQVNERGLEALRMGDVTKILGGITSSEGGAVRSVAGGFSASKGSLSNTVLGGATLVSFPGSFPPPSSGQESLPRGGTAQFYTDDAARRLQQSIPDSSSTLPKIYNMGGRTFMRMGSSGGFVIPHDKTNEIIQKETMGKIPGREFGGSVQSRSVYEVNEGILPELLSIGSRDFLLTGGSSGYVTPTNSASELGMNQNINVTIVTPDVDGFRKTQSQIQNELGRAANLANRRNG